VTAPLTVEVAPEGAQVIWSPFPGFQERALAAGAVARWSPGP
jgi:hypothetical protein